MNFVFENKYWQTDNIVVGVVDLIKTVQRQGMNVMEIGCNYGDTVYGYIDIIKQNEGTLYAIDTFQGSILDDGRDYQGSKYHFGSWNTNMYDSFQNRFYKYKNNLKVFKGFSHDIIPNLPDDYFDLIFIDGDHRYEGVKKDIELCLPKMKKGGILCGHDCENFDHVNTYSEYEFNQDTARGTHAGVCQAVYDTLGKIRIIQPSTWVFPIQ